MLRFVEMHFSFGGNFWMQHDKNYDCHHRYNHAFVFIVSSIFSLPASLSTPSLQDVSSLTEQSSPSQPSRQAQLHSPKKLDLHSPLLEHMLGHPWMVQCLPFHPVTHRHVPFLHWPCSSHLNTSRMRIKYFPELQCYWPWVTLLVLTKIARPSFIANTPAMRYSELTIALLLFAAASLTSCSDNDHWHRSPDHIAGCCSLLRSTPGHRHTLHCPAPASRGRHSPAHTGWRRGPPGHSQPPANPSCRHRHRRCSIHDRSSLGQHSPPGRTTPPCSPSCRHTSHPRSDHGPSSPAPRTPRTSHCTPSPSSQACRHTLHWCSLLGQSRVQGTHLQWYEHFNISNTFMMETSNFRHFISFLFPFYFRILQSCHLLWLQLSPS